MNIDITKNKDYTLFDVNINSIGFYAKGNKIIPIEYHEILFLFDLFKQKNIDIFNYDITSFVYENMDYIKDKLLNKINDKNIYYFLNSDKEQLNNTINEFRDVYNSISKYGYFNSEMDPLLVSRIKRNDRNILCLITGERRFFTAKILGIQKINCYISDSNPERQYVYYEPK
jgi:hypothetical protein